MIINHEWIGHNPCLGCGKDNASGLHAEISYDGQGPEVHGRFTPPPHAAGVPGLTHGGALFTVLDCLACWAQLAVRPQGLPMTRSGTINYRRPAPIDQTFELLATVGEGEQVRCEARSASGEVVADAEFLIAQVPPEKAARMLGAAPTAWVAMLERARRNATAG